MTDQNAPAAGGEPYGACLLRQFHGDCSALLMEYDVQLAPLDNPAVRQFMTEVMKLLDRQLLGGSEKLFKKTYKELPPLVEEQPTEGVEGGEDPGDVAMEGEPMVEQDAVLEMEEGEAPPEFLEEEVVEEEPSGKSYDGMGEETDLPADSGDRPTEDPDVAVAGMQTKKKNITGQKARLLHVRPSDKVDRVRARHGAGARLMHDAESDSHVFSRLGTDQDRVNAGRPYSVALADRESVDRRMRYTLDHPARDEPTFVHDEESGVDKTPGDDPRLYDELNLRGPQHSAHNLPKPTEGERSTPPDGAKSILFSITPSRDGKAFRVEERHGKSLRRADLSVKGVNQYLSRFKGSGAKSLLDGLAKHLNAGKGVRFALRTGGKALCPGCGQDPCTCGKSLRKPVLSPGEEVDAEALHGEKARHGHQQSRRRGDSKTSRELQGLQGRSLGDVAASGLRGMSVNERPGRFTSPNPAARQEALENEDARQRTARDQREAADEREFEQAAVPPLVDPNPEYESKGRERHLHVEHSPHTDEGKLRNYGHPTDVHDVLTYDENEMLVDRVQADDAELAAQVAAGLGSSHADDPRYEAVTSRGERLKSAPRRGKAMHEDEDWWQQEMDTPARKLGARSTVPEVLSLFGESDKANLKLAEEMLRQLKDDSALDDQKRLDCYHLSKLLEPIHDRGMKALARVADDTGRAGRATPETSGQTFDLGGLRVPSPSPSGIPDPFGREEQVRANWQEGYRQLYEDLPEDPAALDRELNLRLNLGASGHAEKPLDAAPVQGGRQVAGPAPKHLVTCGRCADFLKMLSREKAYGEPHRRQAAHFADEIARMLAPEGMRSEGVAPTVDESARATFELGGLEEKDLKALLSAVTGQSKRLEELEKAIDKTGLDVGMTAASAGDAPESASEQVWRHVRKREGGPWNKRPTQQTVDDAAETADEVLRRLRDQ